MDKLDTKYLGLKLKSPVIAGSSGQTSSLAKVKEAEDYGAGAVVLKSLFEEQINYLIATSGGPHSYPEAEDYIAYYIRTNAVEEYLNLISAAKKNAGIPIIPSINCLSAGAWIDYAKMIENAGADALEVNIFLLPVKSETTAAEIEKNYIQIIEKLKSTVKIPLAVKIGFRFTNVLNIIELLYKRGVEGVVMFNRFFEPDIDIEKITVVPADIFSFEGERRYILRWIAMADALDLNIDISASTGIHNGDDAIKYLLAGADTVQVCSAIYKKGMAFIKEINDRIMAWMKKKGFDSVSQFRGKLNYSAIENPLLYERTQFMKFFSSHD